MLAQVTGGGSSVILFLFVAIAVATDVLRHRIPNLLVVIMLSCGLVLSATLLQRAGVTTALLGALVGFLILMPFYVLGGMGAGDVKLLAAIGSFLGPWGALVAGLATLGAGGILGFGLILWRNVIAVFLARFLSIAPPAPAEVRGVPMPYAVAIAIGTVAAVLYVDSTLLAPDLLGVS